MPSPADEVRRRLNGGLVPAVPVPFRGAELAADALDGYAAWMGEQDVAGVAVWAHTGRGVHLSDAQRAATLLPWRRALSDRVIVAGADSVAMARTARDLGADAVLAYPRAADPVGYHQALAEVLPVIAFYLYEEAGGVEYDNPTLHGLFALPGVIGIKVATLDSIMTFQRVADLIRAYPQQLLISGEDRFLGYSLAIGARAALIGMGAALTDLQAELLRAHRSRLWGRFMTLADACDRFGQATFCDPMEGYVRRMLWALAADGVIPEDACDDPWGPPLDDAQRVAVRAAVRDARAAGA